MFLGHFAVGLGAKKVAPELSLGTLFLAAQLADLLWPNLVLLGVERFEVAPGITAVTPLDFVNYPYSHSLLALLLWGAAFALLYRMAKGGAARVAACLAGVVASHWVLDALVHRADLPLAPGVEPRVGLGLWHSLPATAALEGACFAAGVAIYLRSTRAVDGVGRWALWGLLLFLVGIYAANLFGPPPPSTAAVTWSAQAMWLIVLWAYWADRHRTASAGTPRSG